MALLGIAAVAWAAKPVKNGVYQDGVHGVIVGVKGTNLIHAFNVDCHGKTWVAQQFIPITSKGTLTYSGSDWLAGKNGHRTSTTGTMTVSGKFKNSRLIVGRYSVIGCSGHFSASFSYS